MIYAVSFVLNFNAFSESYSALMMQNDIKLLMMQKYIKLRYIFQT